MDNKEFTTVMVALARVEEKLDTVAVNVRSLTKDARSLDQRTGKLEQFRSWVIGIGVGLGGISMITALTAFLR